MRRTILLTSILLAFPPASLYAQSMLSIIAMDATTGQRVEGVMLTDASNTGIGVTGPDGIAIVTQTDDMAVVTASHISYITRQIDIPAPAGEQESVIRLYLLPATRELPVVPVTGRRYANSELPEGRIITIDGQQVSLTSFGNVDNSLSLIPGIYVNRSGGIFSKNTSVSLRGTASAHRTLVMLDGIPLNKLSGSALNWSIIDPDMTAGIEVMKGPGSSLYGTNAMGGIVNVRTRHESGNLLRFSADRSTYNTTGGSVMINRKLGGSSVLTAWGHHRQGDGYINVAPESLDSIHVPLRLRESAAGLRFGHTGKVYAWELEYLFYDDLHGLGRKVSEEDGEYQALQNHQLNFRSRWVSLHWNFRLSAYQHIELGRDQSENINASGNYKLVDSQSLLLDRGAWFQGDRTLRKHAILTGAEIRHGSMDEEAIYRTSTDWLNYGGSILVAGLYAEDLWKPSARVFIRYGIRADVSRLSNGFFTITEPSSATGFIAGETDSYANRTSAALDPTLSVSYVKKKYDFILSLAQGFMPPRLDDLYRSGKISKGFKIANPELRAEKLRQAELDLSLHPSEKLDITIAAYYSTGIDFQYLVATGDSIDMGPDGLRPALQKSNIPEVRIRGAEAGANWRPLPWMTMYGSLSRQQSVISSFPAQPDPADDLEGLLIGEVPDCQASFSLEAMFRSVRAQVSYIYTGEQWADDRNTEVITAYHLVNAVILWSPVPGLDAALEAWNLLDRPFTDRKGNYSPGRFITLRVDYSIRLKPMKSP